LKGKGSIIFLEYQRNQFYLYNFVGNTSINFLHVLFQKIERKIFLKVTMMLN